MTIPPSALRSCAVAALAVVLAGIDLQAAAGASTSNPAAIARETVRPERGRKPPVARPPQLASLRDAASDGGPFAPSSVPSLDGSPVEYLILTNTTFAPAFQRLADWKTQKGVPAVVRSLDAVQAASPEGSDLAETLRLYIRDAYLYWGVRFVLLGGDVEVVPPRYVHQDFLGLSEPITDLYYSCLDGDWNADGDGNFAEAWADSSDPGDYADLVSEVYVGRAPVSTLAEANTFVDKTLEYERPTRTDFENKLLLLAEVLFPVDWTPGPTVPQIDGATFAENLRHNLIPAATQVTRLYQNNEPYLGSNPLTVASSMSEIDAGQGIVVHIGHGWRYTLSVGDGSLDVGEAAGFTNGVRAGLIYMLNCTAAAYDFESFAETMLLNPNGGATVVIGAAREAYPLAAADYQYAFFRHVYALGEHRIGEAVARSRQEPNFLDNAFFNSVDRWTQLTYTLLGDPEVSLRTATPKTLNVAAPASLQVGAQNVQLTVTDPGGPVQGALVCARRAGEEYRVGRTDAAGLVTLRIEPRTAGPVSFTATAVDHLPRSLDVQAAVPVRALVLASSGLTDDGGGTGTGNSDGRLDAGETARLGLRLRNAGTSSVTGLSATLETVDPDIQVVAASSAYPNIAAGGEASATTPFIVRVPPGVVDQRLVALTLRLTHDSIQETRRIELVVHAAMPRIIAVRIDDARAGNGDGVLEANEEVDLYYKVENLGTGSLQQGAVDLVSQDAGLVVSSGSASLPSVLPGAGAETVSRLTARLADFATPHTGRLVLRHLQSPAGTPRRVDLRPPGAPGSPRFVAGERADEVHLEWDPPADADLLGYEVYRASAAAGPFVRADQNLVRPTYFREDGLETSTRYYYRVVAVDSGLVRGAPGPSADVSTNPPQVQGWPNAVNDPSASTAGVADVDGDGDLDIVAGARQIYAWDGHGVELRDVDHDPRTWGYLYGTTEAFGSITLADLDPARGKEIIAATWSGTQRYIVVLHGDGTTKTGWPRALVPAPDAYRGAAVGPVVANLDAQGAPEILLAARDGRLYGWHADGSEIADGDANPQTQGVLLDTGSPFLRCAPGVADLDPSRPGAEVVVGSSTGTLHVIDAHGAALPGWPRSSFGAGIPFVGFASGVSIADLDRDGRLELVVLDAGSRLHALHLDGSESSGFPVEGVRGATGSVAPSPAIGDVSGDSKLEIVAAGIDGKVWVFDSAGQPLLPGSFIDSGAETESSPILGDVDGDAGIEIVLGNEAGVVNAWNLDGTPVAGFPISLRAEVRGTPTLADVDGNGSADLVLLAWDGVARVWDLGVPWLPGRAPWPTSRGNVHRTGEFGYQVPTPVAIQDFAAEVQAPGGVRLTWRGVFSGRGDPGNVVWRVYRAGPFQMSPLGTAAEFAYTGEALGERRGTGSLEFADASPTPGAWYAYVLGMREADGPEILAGPAVVELPAPALRLRFVDNVPNPFNPGTRLVFEIPAREGVSPVSVEIDLFDAQGQKIRTLVHATMPAGRHAVLWDGRDARGRACASGVYVARIVSDGRAATRKLALVR